MEQKPETAANSDRLVEKRRPCVLLIEDNRHIVEFLELFLDDLGLEVADALDPCLKLVTRLQE